MGRVVLALGVVAAVAGCVMLADRGGYARGYAAAQVEAVAARDVLQEKISDRDARLRVVLDELAAVRIDRAAFVKGLENEALADDGADGPGLGVDGLRRLSERWSAGAK